MLKTHHVKSLSHILSILKSTNRFFSARKHQAGSPNGKHEVTESTALIGFLNLQVGESLLQEVANAAQDEVSNSQ